MFIPRLSIRPLQFALSCLTLAAAIPSFAQSLSFSQHQFTTGRGPMRLVRGDFNNDGIADLASANDDGSITVLLSNGDGTFRRIDTAAGKQLSDLAVADFNRDGKPDMVVINHVSSNVSNVVVVLGNGDGTFRTPFALSGAGSNPVAVSTGDIDGDGNPDIVALWATTEINSGGNTIANNHLTILYGNGSGGFSRTQTLDHIGHIPASYESGYFINHIAVGDLNGDGHVDIAFTECCGGSDVELGATGYVRNNGGGSFTNVDLGTFAIANDLSISDINQDGYADYLLPYFGCHTPCYGTDIFYNPAHGTSRTAFLPDAYPFPSDFSAPYSASAADFNNDGLKDVVVSANAAPFAAPYNWFGVSVTTQNADGTFNTPTAVMATPGALYSLVTGDFNKDGRMDFAAVDQLGYVYVFLNTTSGIATCSLPAGRPAIHVCMPADGSTVANPVRFLATPRSPTAISGMKVYVDSSSALTTADDRVSAQLTLPLGKHTITAKAWNEAGPFSTNFPVTVISGASCTATANRSVHICSPTNGVTVSSPVNISAAADSTTLKALQVYIDGTLRTSVSTSSINQNYSLALGAHNIVVKGWDTTGSFSSAVTITVR
jgi:hypothetical protein